MSKLKKLFVLRTHKSRAPIKDEDGNIIYYSSKKDAKKARVNDDQYISYGVDHYKFNPATQGKLKQG